MEQVRNMSRDDEASGRTAFLARAAQRGDFSVFEELYARTAPALYAWAVLRAPADVDAGDILGEVWLRAMERLHTHDGENHEFRAWIFGIAKHVLLQVLRARGNQRTSARFDRSAGWMSTNGLEQLPESVTSISQRLAREDTVLRFVEYAQRLDAADRDLLVHCGVEGGTCSEAATRMGLSNEAATKRWQRLRAELRDTGWVRSLLLVIE
jgi:RNA polymerase sigma factor (sigma-70 family)